MKKMAIDQTSRVFTSSRYLPVLLPLFVGSGCAALIYEVVWFQLLELVIGASAVSMGILLGTFMGGMCLGSFLLPRFVSARHHPLRVYACLELGAGAFGLIILFGMPLVGGIYTAWAGEGFAGLLIRGLVAAICLIPPTVLMGATLPAISRWVETTPQGVSWLGFFYGSNIGGAVIGSLVAGYYLLRVHDIVVTTLVAAALNVAVALLSLLIARLTPYTPADSMSERVELKPGTWAVYVTIAISGMTALASEVIWTRLLSLLLGATTYTFSLILAVFLFGLGIGSSLGSAQARRLERPRLALALCQILLCAAMAWAAYALMAWLPFWPIMPSLASSPWISLQIDLVRILFAILPGAVLWGASFPLALAAVASRGQDPGRLVGGVYAANTVGAIVGSLSASLLLVAWIGSQYSQQLLIALSAIAALLAAAPVVFGAEPLKSKTRSDYGVPLMLGVATASAVLLVWSVPVLPPRFVQYGRFSPSRSDVTQSVYIGEGLTATVAVSRKPDGTLNYHNAGKVQASSHPSDMRLQRMLGHLTTLIPKNPNSILVIGCGAGVTAGAVSIGPATTQVTIAEIEPLVPRVVSTYFGDFNYNVVTNPKVRVVIDDGRHFLETTDQKFDGITSDPLDPWVKGAAALYTKEFFELARSRLNPGGVVTQFVQLYESNEEAVKSEIATFFEVFPHATVWANTINGQGYDLVLLGQVEPTVIDLDEMSRKLNSPQYQQVTRSLAEIGMLSPTELFATYGGNREDLTPWMSDAQINLDRNMRLQYLAGWGLNLSQAEKIFANMTARIRYPENLFTGSESMIGVLRQRIRPPAPVQ